MAWVKVPPEHHPLFRAALPQDRRVETMTMFGGVAAKANGHMFAGLFGRTVVLNLGEAEKQEVLALEGAGWFDPMGDGRKSDKVVLPEALMDEHDELKAWIARAFAYVLTLPRKAAKKPAAKKPAAKKPAAKKPKARG